ncbi:hypothetical protein F2Q69_00041269 [Brassica cretica]|uniref:Uncharacterized protein n=1 Tax=Brassica cretica TaxID=69181 RepID=A0A8S9NL38_BRACR|nr:hypothetical protein F2Q69_00041269 [Brassica cretica]
MRSPHYFISLDAGGGCARRRRLSPSVMNSFFLFLCLVFSFVTLSMSRASVDVSNDNCFFAGSTQSECELTGFRISPAISPALPRAASVSSSSRLTAVTPSTHFTVATPARIPSLFPFFSPSFLPPASSLTWPSLVPLASLSSLPLDLSSSILPSSSSTPCDSVTPALPLPSLSTITALSPALRPLQHEPYPAVPTRFPDLLTYIRLPRLSRFFADPFNFKGCTVDDSACCTVDDYVCSPTPAASPHLTAMSGNPDIFRDGF